MITKIVLGIVALLAAACFAQVPTKKVVCYYDSNGNFRDGQAKFDKNYLSEPLLFCTHLIYGFAGIDNAKFTLQSLYADFDINRNHFRQITELRRNFPSLRILLSVGGGRDVQNQEKYLNLLESPTNRLAFINSAANLLRLYGFDGLDLAWQFPPNKPKKIRGFWSSAWSATKHTFVDPSAIDPKASEHKDQFAAFVRELRNNFGVDERNKLLLSLSVLPNVNSTLFHDVRSLSPNLDFINLWAFDYYTPERNPKEADYPAPLHELIDRKTDENGNYLINYWLQNGTPKNKLVLGIPTFGRSWKMTKDSGISGVPPISEADGAGEAGPYTKEAGLLSYQEVCAKLANPNNVQGGAALRKVGDPTGKYGPYGFKPAESSKITGTWVGYEDPDSAAYKAIYVRTNALGGVALVDLTLEDFRGLCSGNKYPILRSVVGSLNSV